MLLGLSTPTLPLPSSSLQREHLSFLISHNSHRLPAAPPPSLHRRFSKNYREWINAQEAQSPTEGSWSQCLLSKQIVSIKGSQTACDGDRISLSHCVSNHLGEELQLLCLLLSTSSTFQRFSEVQERRNMSTKIMFHSMSYLPGKLTCQHVLESPGRQYSRLWLWWPRMKCLSLLPTS